MTAVLGASCQIGTPEPCSVQCGPLASCPEGNACMADGYCHSREEPGELCSTTPAADASPGELDAASATPDAGGLALDEPCADGELCASELVCADYGIGGSHCKPTCAGPDDCPGPRARCSRTDVDTSAMICSSNCDPLVSDSCSAGDKCGLGRAPDGKLDVNCMAHGGVAYHATCAITADCGPGLICVGVDPNKLCERLCVVGVTDCGTSSSCTTVSGDNLLGGVEYSYCQP